MKTKILTLVLAVAFTVSVVGVSFAAKGAKCEVTGVEGTVVTLDCGADAGTVAKGDKVEIKKAKKAPEGC